MKLKPRRSEKKRRGQPAPVPVRRRVLLKSRESVIQKMCTCVGGRANEQSQQKRVNRKDTARQRKRNHLQQRHCIPAHNVDSDLTLTREKGAKEEPKKKAMVGSGKRKEGADSGTSERRPAKGGDIAASIEHVRRHGSGGNRGEGKKKRP